MYVNKWTMRQKKDLSWRVPSASMKNAFQNAKNCIILSLKNPETETKKNWAQPNTFIEN